MSDKPTVNSNPAGLFLRGKTMGSEVRKGNRKDDGKAYAFRETWIDTGGKPVIFTESVDPSIESEIRQKDQPILVQVNRANMDGPVIKIGGDVVLNGSDK